MQASLTPMLPTMARKATAVGSQSSMTAAVASGPGSLWRLRWAAFATVVARALGKRLSASCGKTSCVVGGHARHQRAASGASPGVAARVPLRHFVAVLALALTLVHPGSAAARKMALLVGVSDYPFLPQGNSLLGPRSDVEVMRDQMLPQLGFEASDVRVLADGVPGAGQPTRAAIIGEVEHLITEAASGDMVVIYLAGHGSFQDAKPEDRGTRSLDGFDALFLPADTKPGSLGRPQGVIVNYEIADWVKKLRGKGAFVWLIADSCFSGYINRDFKSGFKVRDRFVSPEILGIRREDLKAAARDAAAHLATSKTQSRARGLDLSFPDLASSESGADYVGFFAAQSTQTTPEYPMPTETSATRGLFTYTLEQVILSNPQASFAQFRDALLRRYAELQRPPTPMIVGTGLDKNIAGAFPAVRQWPMSRQDGRIVVGAGQLQGVNVGSLLAVLDNATAPVDMAKGYVKVTAARAFDSDVSPVEHKGLQPIEPAGADRATARLVEPGIPLVLHVGVPTPATAADASNQRVSEALAALRAPGRLGDKTSAHIEWVEGGTGERDLTLVVDSGRVWFAGADGSFVATAAPGRPQTYSVPLSGDTSALVVAIWDTLQRIARTTNLARLAARSASQPLEGLEFDVSVQRKDQEQAERVLAGEMPTTVGDGDKLLVSLNNRGQLPADVTVLYIDAAYRIQSWFPRSGETPRLAPLTGVKTLRATFRAASTGRERLFVIAVQGRPAEAASDFSFLEDPVPTTARALQSQGGLEGLLARAGFPQFGLRAASLETSSAPDWMDLINFDVIDHQKINIGR